MLSSSSPSPLLLLEGISGKIKTRKPYIFTLYKPPTIRVLTDATGHHTLQPLSLSLSLSLSLKTMGDDNKEDVHDPEAAEEEALSLCDLPLNTEDTKFEDFTKYNRQSSSEPPEFFEFFCDLTSDMCPADDIIFCGKLVPLKDLSISLTTTPPNSSTTATKQHQNHTAFRRLSASLSELQTTTRSNSTKTRLLRISHSLDSRKLHRSSCSQSEIDRNSSGKGLGKSESSVPKLPKSRWHLMMFGLVRFPPEMELRDIKNRQVRRNPATMFPPLEALGKDPANRSSGKTSTSWGLLEALSCKDHASVAVTASFDCIPHV